MLKNVGVGKVDLIPEKKIQNKAQKLQGCEDPKKQFMKTVNYKNEDKSLASTSFTYGDSKFI